MRASAGVWAGARVAKAVLMRPLKSHAARTEGSLNGADGESLTVQCGTVLVLCLVSGLRWLFWLPVVGTLVLVLFGYCLLARTLSLFPWNRRETLSLGLLRRTYLTPPTPGRANHGLPGRPAASSRCADEAAVGSPIYRGAQRF
jgi:hypothetical protein